MSMISRSSSFRTGFTGFGLGLSLLVDRWLDEMRRFSLGLLW